MSHCRNCSVAPIRPPQGLSQTLVRKEGRISVPLQRKTSLSPNSSLKSSRRRVSQQLGNCLPVEVGGQILSEKRIILRSVYRLPRMLAMITFPPIEGDQSSREFHLWILAAQAEGLLYPGISAKPSRGIWFALANPLLVGLGQIADIEPCQGLGLGRGGGCTHVKSGKQPFRDLGSCRA